MPLLPPVTMATLPFEAHGVLLSWSMDQGRAVGKAHGAALGASHGVTTNESDAHDNAATAAASRTGVGSVTPCVLQRAGAEGGDAVAELVEGDDRRRPTAADIDTSCSSPKLMVSGSSAEQPRPASPKASDAEPRRAVGQQRR